MRSGADDQERIPEIPLVQNGLLKHGDKTRGQKELLPQGYIPWSWGKVREREISTELLYSKEDLQDTGYQRPCHCQGRFALQQGISGWEIS